MAAFYKKAACSIILNCLLASYPALAQSESVIYTFAGKNDGSSPYAGLLDVKGVLYGTTALGGTSNSGVVFQLTVGGAETPIYSFKGGKDGYFPEASLIDVGGELYGTTNGGGGNSCGKRKGGCGTVFKVTFAGSEMVLHAFGEGTDGANPAAGLLNVGGTLFGTTEFGGSNNGGTVFQVTKSGKEKVLHNFTDVPDGANPIGNLINVGGMFYGTTSNGGLGDCTKKKLVCGTVFEVTPDRSESVVYAFKGGDDGASPAAGVIDVGGKLYGTTLYGGQVGYGTVFRATLAGKEKALHQFSASDGYYPAAPLLHFGGALYGTTSYGGSYDYGTVFKITKSGSESIIHSFTSGTDGAFPSSGLVNVGGKLYGVTVSGGAADVGVVFDITP